MKTYKEYIKDKMKRGYSYSEARHVASLYFKFLSAEDYAAFEAEMEEFEKEMNERNEQWL